MASERWRIMEEAENIGQHGSVFAGELINKGSAKRLVKAGIIEKDMDGNYVLTGDGRLLWAIWNRVQVGDLD